jgi:ABC-2 type transport system ATP-binding protein
MSFRPESKIMQTPNLVINVVNLHKKFDDFVAVQDISIQVKRGDIVGFLGPNGSGKTTTIRMLCGLLTPTGGSGTCLGYNIRTESGAIKKLLGYVPQHFSLYKSLTVYENILFMSELYGVTNRQEKTINMMDKLNLLPQRNKLSGSLSGGWKQRLSLACALIHDPFLLLLDEPTASEDPKSRRDFWEIIHNLSAEGTTILLSSHNMNEMERCHRIIYVCNGRILMSGTIKEIIAFVNLTTWEVYGPNLVLLAKQLESTPGIDQVITFFNTLHVSSKNHEALKEGITPYQNTGIYVWKQIETTLEDVFIWLSINEFSY